MELFTSQGCSSCPSADEVLGNYSQQNDPSIICLSFNVDYWNRLGWKDVFSNPDYSARQQQYSQLLHSGVYTPQIVINGKYQFVGSDKRNIAQILQQVKAQPSGAEIQAQQSVQGNDIISINYQLSGNYGSNNLIAVLVQNKAVTKINAGENGGASLSEYNIVRNLKMISNPSEKGDLQLNIPKGLTDKQCSVVLFLQQKNQGAIIAGTLLHS